MPGVQHADGGWQGDEAQADPCARHRLHRGAARRSYLPADNGLHLRPARTPGGRAQQQQPDPAPAGPQSGADESQNQYRPYGGQGAQPTVQKMAELLAQAADPEAQGQQQAESFHIDTQGQVIGLLRPHGDGGGRKQHRRCDDGHVDDPVAGQVSEGHTREYSGTGLGMPICKSLMELHGGNLVINSKPGEGTTVTARFPPERTIRR